MSAFTLAVNCNQMLFAQIYAYTHTNTCKCLYACPSAAPHLNLNSPLLLRRQIQKSRLFSYYSVDRVTIFHYTTTTYSNMYICVCVCGNENAA